MGASEVTPAAGATTATRVEPVARLFAVTAALSIIRISGRDYQRDENLNFSWVFDSLHQSAIAGSFEVSATEIRGGKGAKHG
jgi:hypothetical protein